MSAALQCGFLSRIFGNHTVCKQGAFNKEKVSVLMASQNILKKDRKTLF